MTKPGIEDWIGMFWDGSSMLFYLLLTTLQHVGITKSITSADNGLYISTVGMHLPHQAHGSQSQGLELHYFPLDRQLCRIKILAENTIEDPKWESRIAT